MEGGWDWLLRLAATVPFGLVLGAVTAPSQALPALFHPGPFTRALHAAPSSRAPLQVVAQHRGHPSALWPHAHYTFSSQARLKL